MPATGPPNVRLRQRAADDTLLRHEPGRHAARRNILGAIWLAAGRAGGAKPIARVAIEIAERLCLDVLETCAGPSLGRCPCSCQIRKDQGNHTAAEAFATARIVFVRTRTTSSPPTSLALMLMAKGAILESRGARPATPSRIAPRMPQAHNI